MKTRRIVIVPLGVLALGVLLMFALIGMRQDPPRRSPQPRVRLVESRTVQLGPVAADIDAYGTVTSTHPLKIYSDVTGTIMPGDVPFQPAQAFTEGDILLRIDDRQTQLDRQSAISDLLTALAVVLPEIKIDFPEEYEVWQTYFDSVRFDEPVPRLPEVRNRRVKLLLSRTNVYKLFFTVRNLEIKLEKHELRAPFDGSVVSADLRVGSTARPGNLLGTIINLENLEVELPLSALDVPWVNLGEPVTFRSAEFDGQWEGRIRRIGRSIDPRTQTIPLYVELGPRPAGALLEGEFFEADVPGRLIEDALEIPRRAVYNERFVYLVKNGVLEYREVRVARTQKQTVIVNGGLQNGDTLVVEPLQGVSPGMLAEARLAAASGELP